MEFQRKLTVLMQSSNGNVKSVRALFVKQLIFSLKKAKCLSVAAITEKSFLKLTTWSWYVLNRLLKWVPMSNCLNNDIEGMILLSELSRRRIRSINKLIRVGRDECVVVIRVDKEKGYIDLSKRRVAPEDAKKCENRYSKAKCVHSILRHAVELLHLEKVEVDFEDFYTRTAWYLDSKYAKENEKNKASYDKFKQAVDDPSVLDELKLTDVERRILMKDIKRRLTPQQMKIRADIRVQCFAYEE